MPTGLRQSGGAALAVAMIMMLLISTIGLASMRGARLETLMAQHLMQKKISFNNAESAAIAAEEAWDKQLVECLGALQDCSDDILSALTPAMVNEIENFDWEGGDGYATNKYGKYYVEYLGYRKEPGESQKWYLIYRITAFAEDQTSSAPTIVQTIFRRCLKPDGVPCPD